MMDYTSSIATRRDDRTMEAVYDIEKRLNIVKYDILVWDSDESMIWDGEPEESSNYLRAVDEVRILTEELEKFHWTEEDWQEIELLCRLHGILQMAMGRLEKEFVHLLVQNRQPMEPDDMSFHSSEGDFMHDFSNSSFGEDSIQGRSQKESHRYGSEDIINLISGTALVGIQSIAEMMFKSNYDMECHQAYINFRRYSLDECLSFLQVEKLSIEEILQLDLNMLNSKIRRWNWAIKVFVQVYLASEKHLCDQIFGKLSQPVSETCFLESSKGSMLQLFNFGEGIAIGSPMPENLFCVLDMYRGLADLLPDIEALFPEESDCCILTECREVLERLCVHVRGTFTEFMNAIENDKSTSAFGGGGVHHITRYVINYIRVISDYRETLDFIFGDQDTEDEISFSEDDGSKLTSPVARNLQLIILALESNLEQRSMLYQDASLRHFFMMNNIYYIVKKVKGELLAFLGNDWMRDHIWKYRQHAMNYERSAWNSVLAFLKDDGICDTGSGSSSQKVLMERFKCFNHAFEEIYKAQTAWRIPDDELRDEMRISISQKLVQAYRSFTGRYSSHMDGVRHKEKYLKYSSDNLQNYLLDLFEGESRSLHNYYKR